MFWYNTPHRGFTMGERCVSFDVAAYVDAFTPLRDGDTVEMSHAHVLCPQHFLTGALHKEFTDASREYLLAFPRAKFPERVSPWWVMTGEVIRKRIATGKPYMKADEPLFDKHGKMLVEGTDGDICSYRR